VAKGRRRDWHCDSLSRRNASSPCRYAIRRAASATSVVPSERGENQSELSSGSSSGEIADPQVSDWLQAVSEDTSAKRWRVDDEPSKVENPLGQASPRNHGNRGV